VTVDDMNLVWRHQPQMQSALLACGCGCVVHVNGSSELSEETRWIGSLINSTFLVRGCSLALLSFVSPQSPLDMHADNLISIRSHPILTHLLIPIQFLTRHWFRSTSQPLRLTIRPLAARGLANLGVSRGPDSTQVPTDIRTNFGLLGGAQ
jgi:hypothetical protein